MKAVVGVLLVIAGIAFGLYAGIWWAFIGGIVDIISEVRSPDLSALNVAIGVVKVLFAGLIGWLSGAVFIIPGIVMIESAD